MSEAPQDHSLQTSVHRLLKFRIPLFALLFCNVGALLWVPFLQVQRSVVAAMSAPDRTDIESVTNQFRVEGTSSEKRQIVDTNSVREEQPSESQSPNDPALATVVEPESKANEQEMSIEQILQTLSDGDATAESQTTKDVEDARPSSLAEATPAHINAENIKLPNIMGPLARLQHTISSLSNEAAAIELEATDEPVTNNVVLSNPAGNGGEIRYVVDQQQFSLQPGESHELSADRVYHIQFHRGDKFGDVAYWIPRGSYQFAVEDSGWELRPSL